MKIPGFVSCQEVSWIWVTVGVADLTCQIHILKAIVCPTALKTKQYHQMVARGGNREPKVILNVCSAYPECMLQLQCRSCLTQARATSTSHHLYCTISFCTSCSGIVVYARVHFAASCFSVFLPFNASVILIWLPKNQSNRYSQQSIFRALPNVD